MKLCMSYARSITLELTLQSLTLHETAILYSKTRFVCTDITFSCVLGQIKTGIVLLVHDLSTLGREIGIDR